MRCVAIASWRIMPMIGAQRARARRPQSAPRLHLLLELRLVRRDEFPDLGSQLEELEPLLLIERNRESAHSIDGETTLLAHLHRDSLLRALLERLVFSAKALQFGLHVFVSHSFS